MFFPPVFQRLRPVFLFTIVTSVWMQLALVNKHSSGTASVYIDEQDTFFFSAFVCSAKLKRHDSVLRLSRQKCAALRISKEDLCILLKDCGSCFVKML